MSVRRAPLALALILAAGCAEPQGVAPPTGEAGRRSSRGGLPSLRAVADGIPDRSPYTLDPARAAAFAKLSLACVAREYPNKPGNVLDGDATLLPPRQLTPAFFGCFDWHSAVHGHWAMVRLAKRFPALPQVPAIRTTLERHLSAERLEQELAYLELERNKTFERPYGWGWLLRLATELHTWDDPDGRRWSAGLAPVAAFIASRFEQFLPRLSAPIRSGTHANTAFAMAHALDYGRAVGDDELSALVEQRARDFHGQDRGCPTHFEPSGEDFISPCLAVVDLMRRVLPPGEFVPWLDEFLPPFGSAELRPVLFPVEVKDPRDPRIGHLIGLALHRAWTMRGLAAALPEGDPRREVLQRSARLHRHHALGLMFDSGYGGEHWLASFAVYLLTDVGAEQGPPR